MAGHAVAHDRLARLTGLLEPDLEGAMREAVQAGVVIVDRDSDVYRLRHALLREAVYGACCLVSECGYMPPMLGCWPTTAPAPRPSLPIIAWPPTT